MFVVPGLAQRDAATRAKQGVATPLGASGIEGAAMRIKIGVAANWGVAAAGYIRREVSTLVVALATAPLVAGERRASAICRCSCRHRQQKGHAPHDLATTCETAKRCESPSLLPGTTSDTVLNCVEATPLLWP